MMRAKKYKYKITSEQWQRFVANGCVRAEIGLESLDYMAGYYKGVEAAIADLFGTAEALADAHEIRNRLRALDHEVRGWEDDD